MLSAIYLVGREGELIQGPGKVVGQLHKRVIRVPEGERGSQRPTGTYKPQKHTRTYPTPDLHNVGARATSVFAEPGAQPRLTQRASTASQSVSHMATGKATSRAAQNSPSGVTPQGSCDWQPGHKRARIWNSACEARKAVFFRRLLPKAQASQ